MAERSFLVAFVLGSLASSAGFGQDEPCAGDESAELIFQVENVGQTSEPFAGASAERIDRAAGERELYVGIVSNLDRGAQGWMFGFDVRGDIDVFAPSTDGTVGSPAENGPPGLFAVGFQKTESKRDVWGYERGVVSSVILSFQDPSIRLDPVGTATVLAFRVSGEPGSEGTLFFTLGEFGGPIDGDPPPGAADEPDGEAGSLPPSQAGVHLDLADSEFLLFCSASRVTVRFHDAVFVRGDANDDGAFNIADAIHMLNYLFDFGQTHPLPCADAGDTNDDGSLNISDPIYGLGHLFLELPMPPPPFERCGADPTSDALGCEASAGCGE